jgi:hypothetical protein
VEIESTAVEVDGSFEVLAFENRLEASCYASRLRRSISSAAFSFFLRSSSRFSRV